MQLDLESNKAESVQGRTALALAHLHRIDPQANMARFYCIDVAATLFGDVCLTRRWGRIGARGQIMQHHFNKEEDAVQLFLELLRSKRTRGYGPRTGRRPHDRRARRTS